MSWAWPRFKHSAGYLLDQEEFNTNVAGFAAETDGNLGEHNFITATLLSHTVAGNAANDLCLRRYNLKTKLYPEAASGTMFRVPHRTEWSNVSGTAVTFTSEGGKIMALISAQIHQPVTPEAQSGLNFCIGLDGVPQMNSLIGSGDLSNEYISAGPTYTPGSGTIELDFGTGPGIKSRQTKLLVKGGYRLLPGEHTVRLMARNLALTDAGAPQYVSQRETIVLHLWA